MFTHRIAATVVAALGLAGAIPSLAATEVTLYKGDPKGQTLTLGGWGSGYANESQLYNFSGSNSIEINTSGYYAGGRVVFNPPVDLTDAFADRQAYLVLTIKFPGFGDEGEDIGGTSAYYRGTTVPGQRSTGGEGVAGPKMNYFRVIATVNGQNLVAEDQPVDLRRTEGGWTTLSLPLSGLKGNRTPSGRALLSSLVISGDRPDKFYIGEIRTSVDDAEIFLEESPEEQTVSPYDPVQLTVVASGGLASLEYVWDFDKTDGLQEEAYGETVYHSWSTPGEYRVTLRVRDTNGVKPELVQEFITIVAQ